jgi:hypothetical protein
LREKSECIDSTGEKDNPETREVSCKNNARTHY